MAQYLRLDSWLFWPTVQFRFISWNEFVTDMLSRGEVKQIIVLPETETAIIHLYPGAMIKGNPVKVKVYRGLAIHEVTNGIAFFCRQRRRGLDVI